MPTHSSHSTGDPRLHVPSLIEIGLKPTGRQINTSKFAESAQFRLLQNDPTHTCTDPYTVHGIKNMMLNGNQNPHNS